MAQQEAPRAEPPVPSITILRGDGEVQVLPAPTPAPALQALPQFLSVPVAEVPVPRAPGRGESLLFATGSTVYVLRGDTLFAFDAETLRLKAQAQLPASSRVLMPTPAPPAVLRPPVAAPPANLPPGILLPSPAAPPANLPPGLLPATPAPAPRPPSVAPSPAEPGAPPATRVPAPPPAPGAPPR
jgi:hypothetical protein